MGFVVHTEFQVAICETCRCAVSADALPGHAILDGNPTISNADCYAAVRKHKLLNAIDVKLPTFFRPPVSQLLPPVKGFYCTLCLDDPNLTDYACGSPRSRIEHMRKTHEGHNGAFFDECYTQHLFPFKDFKHCFAVAPPAVAPLPVQLLHESLANVVEESTPLALVAVPQARTSTHPLDSIAPSQPKFETSHRLATGSSTEHRDLLALKLDKSLSVLLEEGSLESAWTESASTS